MKRTSSWQVILADLALILFLTSVAGLAAVKSREVTEGPSPEINAPHAVYRQVEGGEEIEDWLQMEAPDSRAQLTIFAHYSPDEREQMWERARLLARRAADTGREPRVILIAGPKSDLYASLAYDREVQLDLASRR